MNKVMEFIGAVFVVVGGVVLAGITLAGAILIVPFMYLLFGYAVGWFTTLIFPNLLADGLNLLFNTQRFTTELIPIISATLAFIGSFFGRSGGIKTKEEKKRA